MIDNFEHNSLESSNPSDQQMDKNRRGQARLLGECELDLGPYKSQLTEISGKGVKVSLKFMRQQGDKKITVGRFAANIRLIVSR